MRTQVSCQQSGCETGTQLTDIMEGRLEDKEDRRHSLTAQYNKNGTYRLETRCAKYTHTHRKTKWRGSSDLWLSIRAAFLPQVGTSTSPSHTAQQPPITEVFSTRSGILEWEGAEQREQLLSRHWSDRKRHSHTAQQQTPTRHSAAPLSFPPNSLVPLQTQQTMAEFLFIQKTHGSKRQGIGCFCECCSTFFPPQYSSVFQAHSHSVKYI